MGLTICSVGYRYDLPPDEAMFWSRIHFRVAVRPESWHNSWCSMLARDW